MFKMNKTLKGKFTHFQYFDMLQSLRNKNEQKKKRRSKALFVLEI